MKRIHTITICALLASGLAANGLAETQQKAKNESMSDRAAAKINGMQANTIQNALKASDVIGMSVENRQGEKLGDVKELAIDVESGRIVQVIVASGGLLGMGERLSAVPPSALSYEKSEDALLLDIDADRFKQAAEFDMANWSSSVSHESVQKSYKYYGAESSFNFVESDTASTSSSSLSNRSAEAKGRKAMDNKYMIRSERLSQAKKASDIIGEDVRNLQDENLGDVEDLLVDVSSGRVVAVVVSIGGFLGMGDSLNAVPPMALSYGESRDSLVLNATKESLTAAPRFDADEWPDFAESSYSGSVYSAYSVEPYFAVDAKRDELRGDKERRDDGLTAMDQGSSRSDVELTKAIRKGIVADDDLSVAGKNVKVITIDGRVTLRGQVESSDEKRRIGEIARLHANGARVDNQIVVKTSTASS